MRNYSYFSVGWQVEKLRLDMVKFALKNGISAASREFSTTRNTVRKWVSRWDGTKSSLQDHSRRPKHSPNRMPKEFEEKIVSYREKYPTIGSRQIARELSIPYSHVAVHRLLRERGLVKKRRKKWRRKRDLREVKAKLREFEKIQVDVKHLDDIPEFYPAYFRYRLPRYQYTARDVRTGFTFVSYAREIGQTNSVNFMIYLADRLESLGVRPKECTIQTDNGTEFVAPWNSGKRSACEKWVEFLFGGHSRIPPGASTYQSDVEAFHRLIEEELYKCEDISSAGDFWGKSASYVLWFNYFRHNRYKKGSPAEVWQRCSNKISPPSPKKEFFPVLLDEITPYIIDQGGYHVPLPPKINLRKHLHCLRLIRILFSPFGWNLRCCFFCITKQYNNLEAKPKWFFNLTQNRGKKDFMQLRRRKK